MVGMSEVILNYTVSGCKSFRFPRGTDADNVSDVNTSVEGSTSLCRSRIFKYVLTAVYYRKTAALVLHTLEILASTRVVPKVMSNNFL